MGKLVKQCEELLSDVARCLNDAKETEGGNQLARVRLRQKMQEVKDSANSIRIVAQVFKVKKGN